MKTTRDGKPFEGTKTNTLENVNGAIKTAAAEVVTALEGKPGCIEATDIEGLPPGISVIIEIAEAGKAGKGKKGNEPPKETEPAKGGNANPNPNATGA